MSLKRLLDWALLATYPVLNYVSLLVIIGICGLSEFGILSVLLAGANLLAIVPAYGFGATALHLFLASGREAEAKEATTFALCLSGLLTLIIVTVLVAMEYSTFTCVATFVLSIGTSSYIVAENVIRGSRGTAVLVRQRVATGLALAIVSFSLIWFEKPSAAIAALLRGGVLVLAACPSVLPMVRRFSAAFLSRYGPQGLGFGLAASSTVCAFSLDKFALTNILGPQELGKYSLLFMLTFSVANRFSDLYLSQNLSVSNKEPCRASTRAYLVLLSLCTVLVLIVHSWLIDLLVTEQSFSPVELALFSGGAGAFLFADVEWWRTAVRRGKSQTFAACTLALIAGLLAVVAIFKPTRLDVIGVLFLITFCLSGALASRQSGGFGS